MENNVEITENPTHSCMDGTSSTNPTQPTQQNNHQEITEDPSKVELRLDLYLNGSFGVDPTANPGAGTLNVPPDPMPYVYATDANGRRVYGFAYRYTEPGFKILCVCHGVFLTPGQFVEHAGGGVVENPLRHIVVTRFPFSMT